MHRVFLQSEKLIDYLRDFEKKKKVLKKGI